MKTQKPVVAGLSDRSARDCRTLLIVGPVEDGGRDSVFDQFPWRTHHLRNHQEFVLHIDNNYPGVVVCERNLPDGDWRGVLEAAASLASPPPVIVTSHLADEYLWAEVLNLGGYDVLAKPFNKEEAFRTLDLAWGRWADHRELVRVTRCRLLTKETRQYVHKLER
jgi:DNA-binding response OmpR family regulator